jgi:hypothetical protein
MSERGWTALAGALGVAAFVALAVSSLRWTSATYDEGAHLPAGYTYLALGDHRLNPEHPPLAKVLAAAPLLAMDVRIDMRDDAWATRRQWEFGRRFLYQWNDADRLLFAGRLPIVALAASLCLAVFLWARRHWGLPGAVLSLLVCVTSPDVLAHGRLVTTDVAVTLFLFLTVIAFEAWVRRPTLGRAAVVGLAAGAALASKFSALALVPILVVLAVLRARSGPNRTASPRAWMAGSALAIAVALAFVWATYGFHAGFSPDPEVDRAFEWDRLDPPNPVLRTAVHAARATHVVPDPYVFGTLRAFRHSEARRAFLLGHTSEEGFWYYFPATFALKTPLGLIVLVVVSLAVRRSVPPMTTARESAIWVPVLVYLALTQVRGLNIGHRHLLPIYPFLFVAAGRAVPWALGRTRRTALAVVALLAGWSVVGVLRVHPHYLAYVNELGGGPSNGYRLLADSSLDWGQDLKTLRAYADRHGLRDLKLSYFGSADPRYYGFTQILPGSRLFPEGTVATVQPGDVVAVSATNLQGLYVTPQVEGLMDALRARRPDDEVGYSILIYRADAAWAAP